MDGIRVNQKGVEMAHVMDLEAYYSDDQQVGSWKVCSESDGCRALLVAVLDRAIRDYMVTCHAGYEGGDNLADAERSACRWFASKEIYCTTQRGFSFAWICQQLGIDAVRLWAGVQRLDESYEAGRLNCVPAFRRRSISLHLKENYDDLIEAAKLENTEQD